MAFTDNSDLYGHIHEDGINRVVGHLMRQRPSLFNYGTAYFRDHPDHLCAKINAAPEVTRAGNPLFSEQQMIPIPGPSLEIGLNWSLQLTEAKIDFFPGNSITLPSQLGALRPGQMALQLTACVGVDCPSERTINDILPQLERLAVGEEGGGGGGRRPTFGLDELVVARELAASGRLSPLAGRIRPNIAGVNLKATRDLGLFRPRPIGEGPLPHGEMLCFCLSVFAVAHVEWGTIGSNPEPYLKVRLDGMEIVDLRPQPMEDLIECYIKAVLRLGILPKVVVPMETMILNVTEMVAERGLTLGETVTVGPARVPADVPANPAIEENLLKAFINLTVEEA